MPSDLRRQRSHRTVARGLSLAPDYAQILVSQAPEASTLPDGGDMNNSSLEPCDPYVFGSALSAEPPEHRPVLDSTAQAPSWSSPAAAASALAQQQQQQQQHSDVLYAPGQHCAISDSSSAAAAAAAAAAHDAAVAAASGASAMGFADEASLYSLQPGSYHAAAALQITGADADFPNLHDTPGERVNEAQQQPLGPHQYFDDLSLTYLPTPFTSSPYSSQDMAAAITAQQFGHYHFDSVSAPGFSSAIFSSPMGQDRSPPPRSHNGSPPGHDQQSVRTGSRSPVRRTSIAHLLHPVEQQVSTSAQGQTPPQQSYSSKKRKRTQSYDSDVAQGHEAQIRRTSYHAQSAPQQQQQQQQQYQQQQYHPVQYQQHLQPQQPQQQQQQQQLTPPSLPSIGSHRARDVELPAPSRHASQPPQMAPEGYAARSRLLYDSSSTASSTTMGASAMPVSNGLDQQQQQQHHHQQPAYQRFQSSAPTYSQGQTYGPHTLPPIAQQTWSVSSSGSYTSARQSPDLNQQWGLTAPRVVPSSQPLYADQHRYGQTASSSPPYRPLPASTDYDGRAQSEPDRHRFICKEIGCNNRSFSSNSNLTRHEKEKHSNISSRYSCPYCHATFTRSTAMQMHVKQARCKQPPSNNYHRRH